MTLCVDIDGLRRSLGGWEEHPESKLMARELALALARCHLAAGLDVVVPQLLARTEFIDALDQVATEAGATFHELVILDAETAVLQRFLARRDALDATGERHPESAIESGREAEAIAGVIEALRRLPEQRPRTRFIDGIARAYEELCEVVA